MGVMMPRPKRETAEEVVLARADWEALLEAVEDAEDIAAVAAARAEDARWASAVPEGRATVFPHEVVSAEIDGAHPLKAWRKYRGLTQRALAKVRMSARGSPSIAVPTKAPFECIRAPAAGVLRNAI